jgi:hypothetical protein
MSRSPILQRAPERVCSKMLMFSQRPMTASFSLCHTVNRTQLIMYIARSGAKCSKLPPLGAVSAIVGRAAGSVPKVSRTHSREGKAVVNRLLITKGWATETKRFNLD